ncbi:BREX-2 system phosphatase PglZ [Rhodococcoides kroppenstedtii]|uniref:BREX-2 system phosphatase PglZ n=1 Tax=Rhodococcoides kroppenstedtii TaxID=293050 RepID=UPI001FCCE4C0|nr:BREX-2 system phosphatase PglZ [Rhodococcus kroppenstedtii]
MNSLPTADVVSISTLVASFTQSRHKNGVIAVSAAPEWEGDTDLTIDGYSVRVRTAPSVLAIRDALIDRSHVDWVVILTDRTSAEIPVGVLEHLVAGRLSNLDPWPVLRQLFGAAHQEFDLLGLNNDCARAVLRELHTARVTPAPDGVLTTDHLFTVLAREKFGLDPAGLTPHSLARWSMNPAATTRFDTWKTATDAALLEQLLRWIARSLGPLGEPIAQLIRQSGPSDVVPVGLVAALLDTGSSASAAFPVPYEKSIRVRTLLDVFVGGSIQLSESHLTAWGNTATLAVSGPDVPASTIRRAESLVDGFDAAALVGRSDVLPSALRPRIDRFAEALAAAIDSSDLSEVENAWANVVAHRSAQPDSTDAPRDVRVGAAAVRLLRYLKSPSTEPDTLPGWLSAYRSELSWVDGAVNVAFTGADNTMLAAATHRIVEAARTQRGHFDRSFARLVASNGVHRSSSPGLLFIEDFLDRVLEPLTVPPPGATGHTPGSPATPVLLVVCDGMSAPVANDVVSDALRRYRPQWQECELEDAVGVRAALAVLPTVTKFSRCSLLSGALATGTQGTERHNFNAWLQRNGLPASGQVLFHKADMDAVSRGHALATEVRTALEDTERRPVVACVLNDIDDALDRSDPIGTSWSTSSFKHLDALLAAAAVVGRTVVLTSDHGHVVERREHPSVQRGTRESARYRGLSEADPASVHADEVIVQGERVLTDHNRAVLAVDEHVRYTGLKAGYHGGAALSEAVIPVSILVNGAVPQHLGLVERPNMAPAWWDAARPAITVVDTAPPVRPRSKKQVPRPAPTDTLFDVAEPTSPGDAKPVGGRDRVADLLGSPLFAQQCAAFPPRIAKQQIGALLVRLIQSNGRITLSHAASILGIQPGRARRAVAALSQVLNADGVIALSDNGTEVELSADLMFEQFGVAP